MRPIDSIFVVVRNRSKRISKLTRESVHLEVSSLRDLDVLETATLIREKFRKRVNADLLVTAGLQRSFVDRERWRERDFNSIANYYIDLHFGSVFPCKYLR